MLGFLRFLAGVFLLIAVIFAVNDATKGIAGRGGGAITVHQTWSAVSPPTLKAAQNAVERYTHPAVWHGAAQPAAAACMGHVWHFGPGTGLCGTPAASREHLRQLTLKDDGAPLQRHYI